MDEQSIIIYGITALMFGGGTYGLYRVKKSQDKSDKEMSKKLENILESQTLTERRKCIEGIDLVLKHTDYSKVRPVLNKYRQKK